MESGKKASCTVLISNEVTGFKGFTDAISIESAKDAAKQKDIKLEPICAANGKTTDKIKVLYFNILKKLILIINLIIYIIVLNQK